MTLTKRISIALILLILFAATAVMGLRRNNNLSGSQEIGLTNIGAHTRDACPELQSGGHVPPAQNLSQPIVQIPTEHGLAQVKEGK